MQLLAALNAPEDVASGCMTLVGRSIIAVDVLVGIDGRVIVSEEVGGDLTLHFENVFR